MAECLPAIKYGMQTRDNDPLRLRKQSLHVAFSQLWKIDLAWRSRGVVSSLGLSKQRRVLIVSLISSLHYHALFFVCSSFVGFDDV